MVAFWPAASINRLDAISVIQTVVPKHESLMSPTRIMVTHSIVRQIHLIAAVGIHAYSSYKNTQLSALQGRDALHRLQSQCKGKSQEPGSMATHVSSVFLQPRGIHGHYHKSRGVK